MRLPAYAKSLLAARRRGDHPWRVRVMLGETWRSTTRAPWRLTPEPRVALKTAEWRPRAVNWHCVRNAYVVIEDHSTLALEALMTLAAEIAAVAAPVVIEALWSDLADSYDIRYLAWDARRGGRWPDWWSDAQERDYVARASRWYRDLLLSIARSADG